VANDVPPPKSTRRSALVGFSLRLCLWLLLVSAAIQNYFVAPRVEQFLLDHSIDVPWGVVLAWRALHLVNVYFLLFAMLVMIDGIGLLVMAPNRAAENASRTWSRFMWIPPLLILCSILVGTLIGALQVLFKLALR
jgi:hypothetical protein